MKKNDMADNKNIDDLLSKVNKFIDKEIDDQLNDLDVPSTINTASKSKKEDASKKQGPKSETANDQLFDV